jgi:murein DD-endopeptidase MepM/ murein hydrolase activator NlpD
VAFEPEDLSAGIQLSGFGEPTQPLTRREMRQLEAQQAEDLLAGELERQTAGLRSVQLPTLKSEVTPPAEAAPTAAVSEAPIVMRRDRSNRPPLAAVVVPSAVVAHSAAAADIAAVEPVHIPQLDAQINVSAPVIVQPPATTVSLPAPISLIAQASQPAAPKPTVKVRLKHKRRVSQPQIVAPKVRKRSGARIFTLTAMAFVACLAIATSVPANALLTASDLALMTEQARLSSQPVGDGQSVEGTGANVAAGRDGISVTAAQALPTMGAFSVKRLSVNVPNSSNGIGWPVAERKISSQFGDRFLFGRYNFHTGLDFDPAYGTPILSVADGIVSLVENPGPTCGVAVFIEHNVDGNKFTSVYCHMVVDSIPFKAGDTINKGEQLGNIGLTGITTGPHLHLEIRLNDVPVDPYAFLVQHAGKP